MNFYRILDVRLYGTRVLSRYDLFRCANPWPKNTSRIHFDMFSRWFHVCHGNQGLWYCTQVDVCWE